MWRFVQVSDPHLGSQTDGEWNNRFLCTMMPSVIRCLRRDLARLKPDFILATGDINSHLTRDAMFAARDLMDSLELPYYPAVGNHDSALIESREWFLEAFQARLPIDDTVYSFTHKGLHFCVLDPWWKWSDGSLCPCSEKHAVKNINKTVGDSRWALPPNQLAWLDDDLSDHAEFPAVVALHYPLIPIPDRLMRPELRDAGHLCNGDLVLEVLQRHPNVKAVLCGHVHMHFIEPDQGFTHIVTGSMPEYPCEYREIQVFDDRMEVYTMPLSDGSFAQRSLIPGKDWTKGTPTDRSVVIPLK